MLIRTLACIVTVTTLTASPVFSDEEQGGATSAEQASLQHEQQVLQKVEELRKALDDLQAVYLAQLAAIRESAAAAGDTDEVRHIDQLRAEDSRVVRLEPRRWLWKSRNGFFERLSDGHWIEKVPNGDGKLFSESARNHDYVELQHPTTIVRLYDNRCMVRFPKRDRGFRKFYDGGWAVE